jgi:glutathione synthase/RimK-type ligase-like ATP-grasp enzyme
MAGDALARRFSGAHDAAVPIGLASLAGAAFAGNDLAPIGNRLIERVAADAQDAAALMDLSTIMQLIGNRAAAMAWQAKALDVQRLYRRPPAVVQEDGIRLLAFLAPGDFMANAPLEFLLEASDVTLDMHYVVPGSSPVIPDHVPDHDLAFVAVGESDANRSVLRAIEDIVRSWPRPVLNRPERIAPLSRDGACALLKSVPGLAVPTTARIARETLERAGHGSPRIDGLVTDGAFPMIARPVSSHAGDGLAKLDDPAAIAAYLCRQSEREFFVAPFVDYRGSDGMFRKYRIALIEGRPFVCHMAISGHWMIHYLNAGMRESAEKRAEEARCMADFDHDFARRHESAFRVMHERVGLDYFGIDCGETPDGELLLFEVDVAMIVHSMDPPDLFPYKAPQMRKVRDAFRAMLRSKCGRAVG